jgi:hypothetical protein
LAFSGLTFFEEQSRKREEIFRKKSKMIGYGDRISYKSIRPTERHHLEEEPHHLRTQIAKLEVLRLKEGTLPTYLRDFHTLSTSILSKDLHFWLKAGRNHKLLFS